MSWNASNRISSHIILSWNPPNSPMPLSLSFLFLVPLILTFLHLYLFEFRRYGSLLEIVLPVLSDCPSFCCLCWHISLHPLWQGLARVWWRLKKRLRTKLSCFFRIHN